MKIAVLLIALLLPLTLAACSSSNNAAENSARQAEQSAAPSGNISQETRKDSNVKIRITVGDTVFSASIIDSSTGREFISQLPLKMTLKKDYAETEKIAYLPKKLSVKGMPPGSDPAVGDITYYAPWGNLAIFYKDFGYSNGLVLLGKMDSGIEKLATIKGEVPVFIEKIE